MASVRRPASSSTTDSKTSGKTEGSRRSCSASPGSLQSSLEDLLVQKYNERFNATLTSTACHLPRKFLSPYESKTLKECKKRRHSAHLSLGSRPLSTAFAMGSQSRDCHSDENSSVKSNEGASECNSSTSNSINRTGPILPSKGKRPFSAPGSQLRRSLHFSRKSPVFKYKPWIIRVIAYKNGSRCTFARVTAPNMNMLLEECTIKLKLNTAARRVFLANGEEAFEPKDIPHDADVYISSGEVFVDPFKEVKDHLSLAKEASWTMNGVVLPNDAKRGKTKVSLSQRLRRLSEKTAMRVLVFKNGTGRTGYEVTSAKDQMEKFLDLCTEKLNLTSPAKVLYDWGGNRIEDISHIPFLDSCLQNSITPLRGPVWVSKGELFSPTGAKLYIQGVLWALHQKLKPAKDQIKQLNFALDNSPEKVLKKEILSLTTEELYSAQESVDKLIDELRTAIKKHKGQLSKLAQQLQAEEEQHSSYVFQHIKQLSPNSNSPQGLQLKVYENGQETGETVVHISKIEMEKGCGSDINLMMNRLLQMIHQRVQSSPGYSPSGLKLIPACLFDEQGTVIRNPLLLQNEQKVWVSYGEDYRSPYNPVLSLTFDRVVAVGEADDRAVFKTLLDPGVELPAGLKKWEVCVGFPSNYHPRQLGSQQLQERVDLNSHFLQLKENPQMILCPSVHIERRSGISQPRQKSDQSQNAAVSPVWPLSHVWIITKTGAILSKAMPQFCLAVSALPITLKAEDGTSLELYKLSIQKRIKGSIYQKWGFGKDGHIFSVAHSEFVLTYLEELIVREVTQTERHNHHGAWSAQRQEADNTAAEEVSGYNVSDTNQKQVPLPIDTQPMPPGALGESAQLTVALVRKREDKQPQASAQRWAIKQEGIHKLGQWKHSKVENPQWNKLMYMWPLLPNGELNEDFNWPLEGFLIPNAPPLTNPPSRRQKSYLPVRLRVLKNGEREETKAITVTGPDITNMLRNQNSATSSKKQKVPKDRPNCLALEDDGSIKIHRLELQQFLERCTVLLNLPFAARKLFDKDGKEISLLKDLQRDQLVYVSCGEQWIDPQLTRKEQEKRLILNSLESDVAVILNYCAMRKQHNLVLEVAGEVMEGSQLTVAECCVELDNKDQEESTDVHHTEERGDKKNSEDVMNEFPEDSHTKAHRKLEESRSVFKYSWQKEPEYPEEKANGSEDEKANMKHRLQPKHARTLRTQRQQFSFCGGQFVCCGSPGLALGVQGEGAQPGIPIRLVQQNPNDTNQRWILREEDRTFHLMGNPALVLAVSMPKIKPGDTESRVQIPGCSVVLQKYKPYSYGAANQKWDWIPELKVLSAFYTTETDQEITAANQASVCTYSISGPEELHQQGSYFTLPGQSGKTTVCAACSRALRGKRILTILPPDSSFCCATGQRESGLGHSGPFRSLSVTKTDLSMSEAENTLQYLEEMLQSLRKETSVQTIAKEISTARTLHPVKILAYRNGHGNEGGQVITATTMPMLLSMCTHKLQLPRAASRLYVVDGTQILTVPQLKAWSVNECFQEDSTDEKEEADSPVNTEDTDDLTKSAKPSGKEKGSSRVELFPQVTAEDLDNIDETLLTLILRTPIDVWVSCGEPFLPIHALHRKKRMQKENWLQKEKVLADLVIKRHKMRHLQGRRMTSLQPACMIPTQNPIQPVVIEGGWTEASQEEVKLMEDVQNVEVQLSKVKAKQAKNRKPFLNKLVKDPRQLYDQPDVKRVLIYRNGDPKQVTYVWGKNIEELLANSTSKLNLIHPAVILYTPDGKHLTTWDEIERDALICVSSGETFISTKEHKQKIQIRANYARVRKAYGPAATNIVVEAKENPRVNVDTNRCLALPYKDDCT
ncbi:doublecortin domain-containing protein 1-like isoform X2 [Lepisosteus oculatus]|uniref:doublecortin domain-containing protein 1-like isoform X2 n=1 Tax=Lepisosteus oculatus TaxID=7918 RepID=UPI0035F506BA